MVKNYLANKINQTISLMAVFSLPCQGEVGIGECISEIYTVSLTLVGIVAFVSIIYGGFMLLTAAGNASKSGEAMNRIKNAALGIVLLFSSYVILKTINPDLVNFNFALKKVENRETLADPNKSIRIENFDVNPKSAFLASSTLMFETKIFASSDGISQVCEKDTKQILVKILATRSSFGTPQQILLGHFDREQFGPGGKIIPWILNKELKTTGATASDNSVDYRAAIYCLIGNNEKQLNLSAPVTVNIAP